MFRDYYHGLLDECVNPRVRAAFPGHEVRTVLEMGWGGITNGKLLALAQADFDVFMTLDQNLEYQQNIQIYKLRFLVVKVPDNKIKFYEPIFPELLRAAATVQPGNVIHITSPDLRP